MSLSIQVGFLGVSRYWLWQSNKGFLAATRANRCMVTREHDQQWSDFVQVTVMSLFYAEENGYTQATANRLPIVNLFGPAFKRMMRDIVFAVGNYGEVYESAVESLYPRAGTPNELNSRSSPQFASMPGLMEQQ